VVDLAAQVYTAQMHFQLDGYTVLFSEPCPPLLHKS